MVFIYAEQARSRIAALGYAEILGYLELVPEKYRDRVFGGLKPIAGFRPDEPRELKERIKKLAKNISQSSNGPKGNERDWSALGRVWSGWLKTTYNNCVDAALKKYEEEKIDFEEFLKIILAHEDADELAQEDIGEIFKFSPFTSMDISNALAHSLPTRAELTKQREVQGLKLRLAALENKIDSFADILASTKKVDTGPTAELMNRLQSEFVKLSDEFQKLEKRSQLNEEQAISRNNLFGKMLESLTHGNDGISKKLQSYEGRVSSLDKSNIEFIGAVKRIEGTVKVLQKSVAEHDKDRNMLRTSETVVSANASNSAPLPPVHIEHRHSPKGTAVSAIDTLQKLHSVLATNYQAIGLGEKSSEKLAFTVAAAISSGQLTQFVGTLADLVADATLSAIAGDGAVAWDVPAGLCDGSLVNLVLNEVTEKSPSIGGVLLRGFNKSAFDIYGYELKNILVSRLMGLSTKFAELVLIATALKSDACLPLSTSTVELGPVIDTSLLTWFRAKGKITFGQLLDIKYDSEINDQSDILLTSLANQIADMPIPKSELWRRTEWSAKTKLTYFVDGNPDVDVEVVEALLMNWVFPWLSLKCNSPDEVGAFIRENLHVVDEQAALVSTVEKYLAAAA